MVQGSAVDGSAGFILWCREVQSTVVQVYTVVQGNAGFLLFYKILCFTLLWRRRERSERVESPGTYAAE